MWCVVLLSVSFVTCITLRITNPKMNHIYTSEIIKFFFSACKTKMTHFNVAKIQEKKIRNDNRSVTRQQCDSH